MRFPCVTNLPEGNYTLKIYHTWSGWFIDERSLSTENGSVKFSLPVLKIEDGRGQYIGQDAAFILEPVE